MNTNRDKCYNCSQPYDVTSAVPLRGRIPLLLSCGHSACELCITNITKFAEPYECKVCLKETRLNENDLKILLQNPADLYIYFPINMYLLGKLIVKLTEKTSQAPNNDFFIDLKNILKATDTNVGLCAECKVPSYTKCKQCDAIMCDVCFEKIHKNYQSLKKHTKQNISTPIEPSVCATHKQKPTDYYCTECLKAICVDCMIVGGEKSCKNHFVVGAEEKNQEFLDELNSLAPEVDEIYRRLTKSALDVGHLLEDISGRQNNEGIAKLSVDIKNHFAKLHAIIQTQETELLKTTKKMEQDEQKSLLEIKAAIEENIKKTKTAINKFNTAVKDEVNVIGLLDTAKTIRDMPWYISTNKKDVVIPNLKINEEIYDLIANSATLEGNMEIKYNLLATKDIGEGIEIPPPPAAPVFPPEIVKDVREFYKPSQTVAEKKSKTVLLTEAPKYRSKSSSSSSINSIGMDPFTNKTTQLSNNDFYYRDKAFSIDNHRPINPTEGSQDFVYVSHIVNPHSFFVQKVNQQSLVKEMIRDFRKSNNLPKPSLKQVQEGKIFLVYNKKEKEWHRCRIIHIDAKDNMTPLLQVFCIDFGNTERVEIDQLRLIPPAKIQSPPPLAIHCCLANCQPIDGSWAAEDSILMQKIIDNKQVVIHIRNIKTSPKDGTVYECDVTTFEDSVNLALAYVFHERARLVDPKLQYPDIRGLEEKPKIFINNSDFRPNTVEEVQITHIVSPDNFYVRKCYLEDTFDKLCEELDNEYSLRVSAGTVYCPAKDMVCVVNVDKYAEQVEGGGWRRAVVQLAVGHGRVRAALVDSGHTVTVHWSTLRQIKPKFTRLKALAADCHLSGITPLNRRWSTGSLALLQNFQSNVLQMEIVEPVRNRNSLGVVLSHVVEDETICINTEMIHNKFAISIGSHMFDNKMLKENQAYTKNIPINNRNQTKPKKNILTILRKNEPLPSTSKEDLEAKDKGPIKLEVEILSCKSPSLIYVSLVDQQKSFKDLFEEIQTYYSKNKTQTKSNWNVGDKCCTVSTETKTWRRAAILEINKEQAKVFYIDFAVVETVPLATLRELPEEFLNIGGAAITCHLSGIVPAVGDDWPSLSKEYLQELIDSYPRFFITKNGTIKDKSLPVELWVYHITQGGPLEPNRAEWRCLNKKIIEQGLGIPDKSNIEPDSEKCKISDDMISFLNITGSIREWMQMETVSDEKPCDLSTALSRSSSSSSTPNKRTKKLSSGIATPHSDEQTTTNTELQSDRMIDWLPAEELTDREFTAIPTYIDNDAVVYLHDVRQEDDLTIIRNGLTECFKNSIPTAADTYWAVGQPCIARFYLDEAFYRGRVIAVNDENRSCFVHYIDYGNEEMCDVSDLRKRLVMWKIPIQAHKCVLSRIKPVDGTWTRATLDYMHKLVVEKNCFIKITGEKVGDVTPIDIKVGKLWLSEHLVDLQKAEYTDGTKVVAPQLDNEHNAHKDNAFALADTDSGPDYIVEDEVNETKEALDYAAVIEQTDWNLLIDEEETVPIYPESEIPDDEFVCTVSTVYGDLFSLIIQNDENTSLLEEMNKDIEEQANNLPPLKGVYEKKACIALFKEDNKWYRASILEYSEERGLIKVKFVDYGDIAVLDTNNVKEASDKWTTIPAAAVSAKLYGVALTENCDVSEFDVTFLNKEFYAKVIQKDDEYIYVELRNEKGGLLAYQNLIDKGTFVETGN